MPQFFRKRSITTISPGLAPLFEPFECKSLKLCNRIAMSPMTRQFAPDGVLVEEAAEYYGARARGGTGLIVTEGTAVGHEVAHYSGKVPHFYGDAALARWREVVAAVHAEGGAIVPQLWHTGLARRRNHTANPELPNQSASALTEDDLTAEAAAGTAPAPEKPRRPAKPMTLDDIDAVIAAFADSARAARDVGCDGVAIHGAHGYLLDQFFWDRSDRYGGTLENRMRIGVEIVAAVRDAVGPDFAIMLRFSQWKAQDYDIKLAETPDVLAAILCPLADAGVDVFDASTRRFWQPEFGGSALNLAGWAKKLTGKATMTVGSIGLESPLGGEERDKDGIAPTISGIAAENVRLLADRMAAGEFDLAAVGRALIANPDWANKVRADDFAGLRGYDPRGHTETLEQVDAAR